MSGSTHSGHHEAIIIGGGQAGLATAHHLRRAGVDHLVLDNQTGPGGAWRQYWPGLTLFSTAEDSSLPGWGMPGHEGALSPAHVVDYLTRYEQRYELAVERPVNVDVVDYDAGRRLYTVHAGQRHWTAGQVVAATGTWSSPFVPGYPGSITGAYWHSANYPGVRPFRGQQVAVVGGGNSGTQIAAELSGVADVAWYTPGEPRWTPELLAARDAGRLTGAPMVDSLDELDVDHLIWCTGFRPALKVVRRLIEDGRPRHPGLHLLGYGDWTGPGSATIAGVGPHARRVAATIAEAVGRGR